MARFYGEKVTADVININENIKDNRNFEITISLPKNYENNNKIIEIPVNILRLIRSKKTILN